MFMPSPRKRFSLNGVVSMGPGATSPITGSTGRSRVDLVYRRLNPGDILEVAETVIFYQVVSDDEGRDNEMITLKIGDRLIVNRVLNWEAPHKPYKINVTYWGVQGFIPSDAYHTLYLLEDLS
jgi:hypothetical protein